MRNLIICLSCLVLILLSVSMVFSMTMHDSNLRGRRYLPGFGSNVFLSGFDLTYYKSRTDNHVKKMAIFPGTRSTTVNLSDKNASGKGDVYSASVYANDVPNNYELLIKKGTCKAGCTIALDHKSNHTIFIRGFSFTQKGKDDMHSKLIAIKSLEPGRSGKTFIAFKDKDKEDKFDYEIWYSNVPNYKIKQKIVLNKNAKSSAEQKYILSNSSLTPGIVSFSFKFRDKDHHLKSINFSLFGKPEQKNMALVMGLSDWNGDDKVNYFGEVYYFDPYSKQK